MVEKVSVYEFLFEWLGFILESVDNFFFEEEV